MASPTGAQERAQLRRCNRASVCIITHVRMCTGFISWLTMPTVLGLFGK